jgi:trk system potassium uptake protein TrkH
MRRIARTLLVVLHYCGPLLIALACALTIPLLLVLIYGEFHNNLFTLEAFLLPAALSLFLGILLQRLFVVEHPTRLQSALICSVGWLGFSAIGALPFVIGIGSTYLDGFFEAMSGFTTTGITMFTGLDEMPKSILFWRAMTQWVGGLGILTMFMLVVFRGGSPHKLFGAEGHKINVDRPVPGLANTIKVLFSMYAGFTCFIALALFALGMGLFDSICNSFTALSTGGFSPHDASIEYYRLQGYSNYVWMEYVIILGMLLGGTSFVIHYRVLKGSWRALFDNIEARYWWSLIGIFVLLILFERLVRIEPLSATVVDYPGFFHRMAEDFRIVLFQVVSILTTTGFATRDINTPFFGEAARQFFLVMMVIGGCVGSTGGGIKVLRIAIMGKLIQRELYRLRVPQRAINAVIIDGELIQLDEIQRVGGLFFMWMVLLIFGGGVTEYLSHHNGYVALSGMFSALGNIGPCYIPVAEMGQLHPIIKMVYILGMLAGRLEIIPVLLLFSPKAWRS